MRFYAEIYYDNLKRIQSHDLRNFLQQGMDVEGSFVFDLLGIHTLLFIYIIDVETNETIMYFEFRDNYKVTIEDDEKLVSPFKVSLDGS